MENKNFEVTTAQNGQVAFEKFRSCNNFDLVILDLNMPISDGYEACQNIRNLFSIKNLFNQNKRQQVPPVIIACSSFVEKQVSERCIELGFDEVIEAPLSEMKFTEIISPLLICRIKKLYHAQSMQQILSDSGEEHDDKEGQLRKL